MSLWCVALFFSLLKSNMLLRFQKLLTDTYLLKPSIGITRIMCEICSKLTIETPEWRRWIWTYFTHGSGISTVDFKQVNAFWVFLTISLGNFVTWIYSTFLFAICRDVLRTQSNIYDRAFCKKSWWLKAVYYFRKKAPS